MGKGWSSENDAESKGESKRELFHDLTVKKLMIICDLKITSFDNP